MLNSSRIESYMTEYPIVVTKDLKCVDALIMMREQGFRHLPVIEPGKGIVGIVSQRDLVHLEDSESGRKQVISAVMTYNPYVVDIGTPLKTVAQKMATGKYGSAVVLNEEGQPVGIFTTTDALLLLSRLLENPERYPVSRIAQVRRWWEWDMAVGE